MTLFRPLCVGLVLAQSPLAIAEEKIQGEIGTWNSVWHGVGHAQPDASTLPRACPVAVQALNAAEQGQLSEFCSLFGVADTNAIPSQVRGYYDRWREGTRRYIYLMAQEAFQVDEQDRPSIDAIAIVPSALRAGASAGDTAQPKPEVIFATMEAGRWVLLHTTRDRKIEQHLISKTSVFGYRHREFSKEANDREIRRSHEKQLDDMRKRGSSQAQLISATERLQALEAGVVGSSQRWSQWTNYYKVKFLTPPVSFDNLEPCEMDFTTPTSACRSYIRAMTVLDEPTLLTYADETGTAFIKKTTLGDSNVRNAKNVKLSATHLQLLLTAQSSVNGKDYVMVLSREQMVENRTDGVMFLQKHFFVHDRERKVYLYTRDVESSTLADILPAANAVGTGIAKYGEWVDRMKNSLFPQYFYEFE